MCTIGVAHRMHTPRHQKCDQERLLMPSVDVFQMHNAKKRVFDVARQMHISLHQKCEQYWLWIPSMGVLECTMLTIFVFGVAR